MTLDPRPNGPPAGDGVHDGDVAVVGMACRFPGARDVAEYWRNLCAGVESVRFFTDDELLAAGALPGQFADPAFVKAYGALDQAFAFDAPFFGVSQREAQVMDPQQRVFLEVAWSALEDAGVDPERVSGAIGVYAGSGSSPHLARVRAHPELVEAVGGEVATFANARDFLTTRVSYKLGLRGPSVAVQTACSTSLVAIHLACQALLNRECDVALGGGVTISPDQASGYRYQEGGILSPDGHCRAFDAGAAGTVGGSGAGVVVLKRLDDALRDGDTIRAVVKGSAINNDGSAKIGFTAPSVQGQAKAIAEALALAGVDPRTVGFVETHGTGTPLGDPIEIAALTEVFTAGDRGQGTTAGDRGQGTGDSQPGDGRRRGFCALGAVKTNLGHLDTAAGVAGFIKAVLALEHGMLPPTLHFERPNPETGLDGSPFYVNTALAPWPATGAPRRAGVSSFGMGGTNAHVVLEEAPAGEVRECGSAGVRSAAGADAVAAAVPAVPCPLSPVPSLLVVSAKSDAALERMRANLAAHLAEHPRARLAEVAFTLQEGRAAHPHRWAAAARDPAEARAALAGEPARTPAARRAADRPPPVAFLFPGQGTQYAGMARALYEREPAFRRELDRCADALPAELDLRAAVFPPPGGEEAAGEALRQTRLTQPALFAVEYALARLWMSWGVQPGAMLGHSIGEYVAACLAGVFAVDDAVRLVEARGRLMQALPPGAMLAVPMPEDELRPLLPARLSLAAVNSAAHCVVSGDGPAVDEMEALLAGRGVAARRLHTSHAFHSAAMDPVLGAFAAEVARAGPRTPSIPFVSNLTGDWITDGQATDPGYWVRHLRETVRFADGVGRLLDDPRRVLLEVGPGDTLGTFARRHPRADAARVVVKSLAKAGDADPDGLSVLDAAGALWTAGVTLDWAALRGSRPGRRIPLPTYPFDRTEYRVPPPPRAATPEPAAARPASAEAPRTPEPLRDPVAIETNQAPTRAAIAAERVAALFARLLGTAPGQVDPSRSFLEMGADSLLLMQASRTLESSFGVKVPFRKLLEGLSTVSGLAAHLEREAPHAFEPPPAPPAAETPVAIPAAPQPADGGLQEIVAQQLALLQTYAAIVQDQLGLLKQQGTGDGGQQQGTGDRGQGTAGGNGARPVSAGAARFDATVAAAERTPALPHSRTPAPEPEPTESPASHGPHRPVSATMGQGGGFDARQAAHFEELVRAYTARTGASKRYAAEGRHALADNRASLNFRLATKELLYPIVGERSDGARLWDLDGNEYVDFTIGFGVHFFGHRPAFVVKAVEEQLRRGFHLGPQSDLAAPVARLFGEMTGMERVTFCNTGSEAVMTALRIARAATGRDRVVLFEGSYHGCFDGILARRAGVGPDGTPRSRPVAPGTPQGMVDDVVLLPYGTPEALEWLRANADTVGAVLVEPVQSRNPEFHPREFLHELRALTGRAGTALVFDEMITGLRLEPRGAQGFYGVDADLATYGKVIGGGFPLGVVAGRARFMDAVDGGQWSYGDDSYPPAAQTFFAGTFCKHPVTMAAAHAVLLHLRERGPALYHELNERTARLVARLRAVLEDEGVPVRIRHCASLFQFRFREADRFVDLLFYHMLLRGIYIWEGRACFLSTAHTDDDCDRLVQALRESVHALREGGFLGGVRERASAEVRSGAGASLAVPADLKLFPPAAAGASPEAREGASSEERQGASSGERRGASPGERQGASPDGRRSFPLTPAQRQVWVHAQLGDDASRAYNEQVVFALRGPLDADALRAAVDDVARHHESLRTVFDAEGEAQTVLPSLAAPLAVHDADEDAAEAMERAVREVFDLRNGPLFRVHVHPRGPERQVVQVVMHHLVADGFSGPLLERDLAAAYAARRGGRAPALPDAMQFGDYAARLAAHAAGHAAGEAAWLARFRGARPLELPTDRPRPRFATHRAGTGRLALPPALAAGLREAGRREGLTLFTTLLGALLATVHRVAGQDDFVVGVPTAGRPFPGSDTVVGHCVDVLPLRSRVEGGRGLAAFLRDVRGWLLDAYENEAFSSARLHEGLKLARGPGLPPLISVTFNLEPAKPSGGAGDEGGSPVEAAGGAAAPFAKFDLHVDAVDSPAGIELVCLYAADLFDAGTVARLLARLRRVLEQVAAGADVPLAALELLDDAERTLVVEAWNRTETEIPAGRIHELFAAQAKRTPGAEALRCGDRSVSYRALDEAANRLAHHLVARGVRPETLVGVFAERAPETVAAILAVLKAGGAFVPLDPAYPPQRLRYMLEDCGARIAIAPAGAPDAARGLVADLLDPAAEASAIAARPARAPKVAVDADALAYVIYTSGSTGRPKGVMVTHRGIPNLAFAEVERLEIGAGTRVLQFASFSFDAAVWEVFAPLVAGATVVLAPRDALLPGPALADTLRRERITLATLPPSALAVLPADGLPDLRTLVSAGEALPPALVERWSAGRTLVNAYGPTETTVCPCCAPAVADGRPPAIGTPLPNVRLYVVDAAGRPAPIGVPGELLVGGVGVARGYLGRPGQTAERFVPDPFGPAGGRLYRTGDRARWRETTSAAVRQSTGVLEFAGRVDAQVKVRGYRVEPGEVEAALRRHPAVADCAVAARDDAPGGTRLVAYVVGGVDAGALREHLRATLPEHMLPAAFVGLGALPLTPNGKVDRAALPAPDPAAAAARYVAPRTPTEEVLAAIWGEVLEVRRVGTRDGFFELGGHSLLATRVAARVRAAFGVELPVRALFEAPTVAGLAARVDALRGAGGAPPPPVLPARREGPAPLSFAQERLWFLDRLQPDSPFYNLPVALRLDGPLHAEALERALGEVVRRHQVLRTTFAPGPVQVVSPFEGFALPVRDLSALDEAAREAEVRRAAQAEAMRPFDLSAGPLFRAGLLRLGDDAHVLLATLHHIVGDGWSMGILFGELAALYEAFRDGRQSPLPELPVQYADYAAWQREQVAGEVLERQLAWWRERLEGAPPLLELPTDHPRPAEQSYRGAHEAVELPVALLERLEAVARGEGATLYMVLLAAFQVLLGRYAGSDDVVVGSPIAGRTRAEVEPLVGCFVNTLVLRTGLGGDPTFGELLARVREVTLGAYGHQEIPFEKLVEALQPERSLSHSPLFQVMFTLANAGNARALPGLRTRNVELDAETVNFDLTLYLQPHARGLLGALVYATDLFERASVARMVGHLARVLEQAAGAPGRRLSRFALMGPAEREHVLTAWNPPAGAEPPARCAHELFEDQARRAPGAPALVSAGATVSLGALERGSNRLARLLRGRGVGHETAVGVLTGHSVHAVAPLLAVLKAGGIYLPLHPDTPPERIAFILRDAGAALVLAEAGLEGRLPAGGPPVVTLDPSWSEASAREGDDHPVEPRAFPESTAYLIYTSGSTGVPKAVVVPHGAAAAHLAGVAAAYGHTAADRGLVFAALAFDQSVEDILAPLVAGGSIAFRDAGLWTPAELAERVDALGVTAMNLPTPYWNHLVCDAPAVAALKARMRAVIIGNEPLQPATVRAWDAVPGRPVAVINGYGPTETVVTSTLLVLPGARDATWGASVPIGRTVGARRAYVLDAAGEPMPVGVPGEVCIGGPELARGYLARPALTAAAFLPDPFRGTPGARLYRTGDRARWRADGTLEFICRIDQQVKVRGFRVEPGEIEAVLRAHPGVRECCVDARPGHDGEKRLAAYVVGDAGADALRAHLRRALPEWMVPGAFVFLDALPLTRNGKVDRRALPEPETAASGAAAEPRTPVEEVLAGVWAGVLRRDRVGVDENFFEAGGHSLLAMRVLARIRELFAVEVPVRLMFEGPTVAELAGQVEAARRAGLPALPPIVPADRALPLPLSFGQERFWFVDRLEGGSAFYLLPEAVRLGGALDVDAMERALGEIVRRHESLRTTFHDRDGQAVQVIAPFSGFALAVDDLSALPPDEREAEVRRRAGDDASRAFDLTAGPLFRARLLKLADDEHVLLVCMHHAVGDGWSMDLLFRELSALYAAFREGRPSPLAEPPVQYADFAVWQRRQLGEGVLERQLAYWRARLAGAPALLALPTDRPRPAAQSYAGSAEPVEIPAGLLARLQALGRAEGATLYMVLLGAFQVLLGTYAASDDVVVGSPIAGRARPEVEGVIGFFLNSLVMRTGLAGDPGFREVLRRVREVTLGAYEHQDVPFERLVAELRPERSLSHAPLAQVTFTLDTLDEAPAGLPGLRARGIDGGARTTRFDLTLDLAAHAQGVSGRLEYATALFDRATVVRMVAHLHRVLEQVAADPDLRISRLELLGADERRVVLEEWNRTARPFPRHLCIHERFEDQARATPGAAALEWGGLTLTYAALDARANRLAHHLRRHGVGPEGRVGVLLERGPELVVALLAALKAGGCYVPLDPEYPAGRLALMLADSGVRVLVTRGGLPAPPPSSADVTVVRLDEAEGALAAERDYAPMSGATPRNLAYVVYTSGSTGRPKGVMVAHREVMQLVRETDYVRLGPGDRVAQASNASFDALAFEAWGALLNGATLVGIGKDTLLSPQALGQALRELRITTLYQTTALLNQLSREQPDVFAPLAEVLFGGQAADADGVRRLLRAGPPRRLLHMYGPTETTAWCSWEPVEDVPEGALTVPVGRPTGNARIYLLGEGLTPVPVGVPGEAYVGGDGIVRGYLDLPGLTALRFLPDPFSGVPGARMYRTGDRLRWRADGTLEFVGRVDEQVKIRGFRIEPGEVEAVLSALAGVREARVVVREDTPGEPRLVAYVVGEAAVEALGAELRRVLPEYMLPAAVVALPALPLTPNGKLDRAALPTPGQAAGEAPSTAPRTPVEEALAALWREVLNRERVGVDDSFFELGGHSLLIMRLLTRVAASFGVALPIRLVFTGPTLGAMAAEIERRVYEEVAAMPEPEAGAAAELDPVAGG